MSRTFYIIDGHSQIFRAYYAPFRNLSSPAGEPTRATYVFTTMLLNLIDRRKPDYLAMALDAPAHTLHRRTAFCDYKATRQAPPEDLPVQERRIEQIVSAMGIPIWQGGGVEADDYLASAATKFASPDLQVVLVSRDKDLDQLIDHNIILYDPMKDEFLDAAGLQAQKGFTPQQAVEIQVLCGDSTDNVPGVKGIGPKTAVKLVQQYGSADAIIARAQELTPRLRDSVLEFAPRAALVRELVTLRKDIPLPTTLEQCAWKGVNADVLLPIFEELGFTRLVAQLREKRSAAATAPPPKLAPAPHVVKPSRSAHSQGMLFTDPEEKSSVPPPTVVVEPGAPEPTTARDFNYRLVDTPEEFQALCQRLQSVDRLAVDTETTDWRPMWGRLVGISLAWEEGTAYYVPVRGPMGACVLDEEIVRQCLGPILANPNIKKLGHNLKYDAIVLAQANLPLAGIDFDTYLAGYVLDAAASGKLDSWSMTCLNHRCVPITDLIGVGSKVVTMDRVPTDLVAEYSGEDADCSLRLANVLQRRLKEEGLSELLGQVEMPLLDVLVDMERAGIKIDVEELRRQELELTKQADALRERIIAIAGVPFSPDSPKQLADVLFNRLKLPVLRRSKTGPSTDAGVLERLAVEHELPAAILDYRQLTKLISTYLRALADCIHPVTGRVHASFNQGGTITGRLSSNDPNLQNIPIRSEQGRRIRTAFVAGDADSVLLSADYSQIELRVLAHFCQDETLIAAFEADQDIHRIVAGEVFGIPAEEVSPEQRSRAKTVNFGIIYGQTAFGLSQTLRIDQREAQDFIDRYRRRFPRIDAFLGQCIEMARSQGYVETIMKRRRPILDIASRNPALRSAAERMAINSVVQGSAADLIKLAMVNIHRRLKAECRPSRMLLQIHDELVFETPKAALDTEREMIVHEMENAMRLRVPLKVDTGWGHNWMEAK